MQKEFNTALTRYEVVPGPWGPEVHIHVLDGEDEAHTIIIDRKQAAEVFRDAGNVWLGSNELWEEAVSL